MSAHLFGDLFGQDASRQIGRILDGLQQPTNWWFNQVAV